MMKRIYIIIFLLTISIACKKEASNPYLPSIADKYLGTYSCIKYSVSFMNDSLHSITLVPEDTINCNVFRKKYDANNDAIYLSGFHYENIPCSPDSSLAFQGSARYISGLYRNIHVSFFGKDSIYIKTEEGFLGRIFHVIEGVKNP
ncbi:MAG: hypothetical protein Q8M15_04815 [Bacteroidota bacterium]|nr:hypothetical protein [Bacteroidota bacterium]